ncbi:hypothetical protein UFOVP158_31 [uncultured Caudovirales phage]|uniref:Uncharacterized protein n=1 Tax=uncultured Caudovirales phage TaxID=2100421 RepID=A0A6J7W9N2_9CAUD|nr:hypothetical protein UFOVP158_31 [uncultured Caudovirales phage]
MSESHIEAAANDISFGKLASELALFDEWFNAVLSDASDTVPRGGTSWVFAGGARKAAWHGWAAARGVS